MSSYYLVTNFGLQRNSLKPPLRTHITFDFPQKCFSRSTILCLFIHMNVDSSSVAILQEIPELKTVTFFVDLLMNLRSLENSSAININLGGVEMNIDTISSSIGVISAEQ